MNKGTEEGTEQEINFVKELNKNKNSEYWDIFNLPLDKRKVYAVRVTSKKFGKVNKEKVLPKADIFLAYSEEGIPPQEIKNKDYYLDEEDLIHFKLALLNHTGISVKREDSTNYQIMKMSPDTFQKLFSSYELGAGASIYCQDKDEIYKNESVLKGWKTDIVKFKKYFKITGELNIETLKKIKDISNKKISEMINSNSTLEEFIFKGVGNFDGPFTATWFYEKGSLKKAGKIPFNVTTGSGRSHGDFTLVIKPRIT